MKSLLSLLVCSLHALQHTIARPFGMLFGGFICGFKHGIQDAHDSARYLKFKAAAMDKAREKKDKDDGER